MRRAVPIVTPDTPRDAPICAWLHRAQFSRPTVAVTFPGTYRAFALTAVQVRRLRKALAEAEALLARDDGERTTIDLMKRIDE